jgi:hypothetical protein
MAAKLARLIYRMLRYGMKYVDKGAAFNDYALGKSHFGTQFWPSLPPFPFQFGKGSRGDPARARLFDLVWLSVPSPEVTSHFRGDILPRILGG